MKKVIQNEKLSEESKKFDITKFKMSPEFHQYAKFWTLETFKLSNFKTQI